MKKLIGLFILVAVFGSISTAFAVDPTPSTNDINKTKTPDKWAHVNQLTIGPGTTDLEFVSERAFFSCFEYRTDGDTSQVIAENGGVNYNTLITDGLYPYYCKRDSSSTHTISANVFVEVRMVFGAEEDERFDWTRFEVGPPLPHISCNDDSGSFLAPFNHPIYFQGKKTNRNLPLKFSCVDENGLKVDDAYMVANGWEPPVVNVTFLASGGSTDPGFEADLLPGGLATDGNQFIYDGEHWMLVLGLKAYTAVGVYTISAAPGDGNYTMDVSETYEKIN